MADFLSDLQHAVGQAAPVVRQVTDLLSPSGPAATVSPSGQPQGSGGFSIPVEARLSPEVKTMLWVLLGLLAILALVLFLR